MSGNHIYGEIKYDQWYPAYGHRNDHGIEKLEGYEVKFFDNIENPYQIKGIRTDNISTKPYGIVSLKNGNNITSYQYQHVLLATAFPEQEPNETIDHINDDPDDNRITNLQWMSRSENSRKGQKKATETIKQNGGRKGKLIRILKNDQIIGMFRSIEKIARFIISNWEFFRKHPTDIEPQQKTIASKISRALKISTHRPYGLQYIVEEKDIIDSEIWINIPNSDCKISSNGIIKGPQNKILIGTRNRNNNKYTSLNIKKDDEIKRRYVHRLVWEAFNGPIPEGLEILHDDEAPLNPDGSYRNHLEDLRLGTRSENMIEFHGKTGGAKADETGKPKLDEVIPTELTKRCEDIKDDDDEITKLMKSPPTGIQYFKETEKRGSRYILSRRISPTGKDMSSTSSKKITDRQKFIEIYDKFQSLKIEGKN